MLHLNELVFDTRQYIMNYELMDHTRLKIISTGSRISLLLHAEILSYCKQDCPPDASRSDGSVLVSV